MARREADIAIGVKNRVVLRRLVFEDAGFGRDVVLHRTVTVEVIGRDVEDRRDMRTEGLDRLQLEARNLQHNPGVRRRLLDKGNCRRADISPDQRLTSARGDDFAGQRGGGGFAVGAGDGHDLSFEEARRQLDFSDDRDAETAGVLQRADVAGDSGADHNQILIAEGALAVLAGFHRNATVEQRRNFGRELILALGIADRYPCATRLQKERRGHARLAQSNHQNPFAFDIHKFFPAFEQLAFLTYRNFSVVRANKAKINEPIQKRTITFDSDQPSCSK